jgi:hypothetical protein
VDALAIGLVVPVGLALAVIHRRGFKLFLGQRDHVTTAIGVVVEHAPGNGVVLLAEPEEAAERHDRVGDLA